MAIDLDGISTSLRRFVVRHNAEFQRLAGRQSQLLEIGALMISAKHYELAGYSVRLVNPAGRRIRVKLTTNGDPWNFSRFELQRDGQAGYEIHSNLPVTDALGTPGARYVVDVAVVKAGHVPTTKRDPGQAKWRELPNDDLVTFVEAKALVIYPMLIAQFIGIVHEIKPDFLGGRRPRGFLALDHFDPALVSLGYLHGTCRNIVRGLDSRRCRIGIVAEFDRAIRALNSGGTDSALSRTAQLAAMDR